MEEATEEATEIMVVDEAQEAVVVVEVVRVVKDKEFIGRHLTMQPSIAKTRRYIAGHMGDAIMSL